MDGFDGPRYRLVDAGAPFRTLSIREYAEAGPRLVVDPYILYRSDALWCPGPDSSFLIQAMETPDVVLVRDGLHNVVAQHLDDLDTAACGELSWAFDPCHPIDSHHGITERIIEAFTSRGLPVGIITHTRISEEVFNTLAGHPLSFVQAAVVSEDEPIRSLLMPEGPPNSETFENMERSAGTGLHTVCRIDPIIPYVTDRVEHLASLIQRACDHGAGHIMGRMLPGAGVDALLPRVKASFGAGVAYDLHRLYTDVIHDTRAARLVYRQRVFDRMRNECERRGITFAVWLEDGIIDGEIRSLNHEFMSAPHCTGVQHPSYVRRGATFEPEDVAGDE